MFFSAVICAEIGSVFGLAVSRIVPSPYQSEGYEVVTRRYPLIGAIAGFLGGGIIAAVQQLNEQSDRQNR